MSPTVRMARAYSSSKRLRSCRFQHVGQVIGPGHGLPGVEFEAADRGPARFVLALRNIAQEHGVVVPGAGVVRIQLDGPLVGFLGAGPVRVSQQVALRVVGLGQVRIERERAVDRRLRASHQRIRRLPNSSRTAA